MITRKAGPGWAAGCTGVIRPASQTPFSALALAVLAERAGMPPGVCNILTGGSAAMGGELTSNPLVRKLSFTGSTEVGAKLLAQCAPTIKKTSMELGGNAPFIVFDDADLDAAVVGAMGSKFRNTGQTCVCANRILVQDGVYEAFSEKLKLAVEAMKVGNGMEPGVSQGPLINADALAKVEEHVANALSLGASIVTGGKKHRLGGNFYEPTVLANVPASAMIFREETFGPVAPLFRFKTEAEAIRLANDTEFGLAAYFYARDIGRIFRVGEALEYGIVGINEGIISTEVAPFGGMKSSGLGREGSKYGIEDYLEIKYLAIGGDRDVGWGEPSHPNREGVACRWLNDRPRSCKRWHPIDPIRNPQSSVAGPTATNHSGRHRQLSRSGKRRCRRGPVSALPNLPVQTPARRAPSAASFTVSPRPGPVGS